MSMIGVGMQAAGYASQMLSSLLSQLGSTSSSTDTSSSSSFTGQCSAPAPSPAAASSSNALTGSTKPSLGGQVLMTLMHMQEDTSQSASGSAAGASGSDPLQNLFSAMDSDGDGSVSQSEMESYVQNAGGTATQADQLYTALGGTTSTDSSTSSGITEQQMASDLPQAPTGAGGHHGHHHAHGAGGKNGADALLQALDTNDDGSVSQDEFSNFVTSNGGTQDEATSDFSALDTTGAGSLSSADFANAWENLQNNSSSSNAMMVSVLNAFASANTAAASSTSVTA
jgi:Ca2+-binding EF-hand superfamily protein